MLEVIALTELVPAEDDGADETAPERWEPVPAVTCDILLSAIIEVVTLVFANPVVSPSEVTGLLPDELPFELDDIDVVFETTESEDEILSWLTIPALMASELVTRLLSAKKDSAPSETDGALKSDEMMGSEAVLISLSEAVEPQPDSATITNSAARILVYIFFMSTSLFWYNNY